MEVNIENPVNGWIKIDFIEKDQLFSDTLSNTPEDFIYKLIEALNLVCSSEGEFILKGYSEPAIYNITFESKGDDVLFVISFKENHKSLFRHTEPKDEILLTFFRALSKMKSTINDEEYKKSWHYDFPEIKFQNLKSYLKQIKKTV